MKKLSTLSTLFAVASLATATSLGAPTATATEPSKQEKLEFEAKVNAIPAIAAAGDKNYIPRQFERSAMEARSYRVHDSRDPRRKTTSGKTGKIPAYTTQVLDLPQYNQEPHEQASAYVLNITAINPESNGFITVWHGRGSRPSTSSVNYTAGQVIANQVHVKADPAADETYISVYSHATTHYVVDLVGRYTTGREHFVPMTPTRVHDSRADSAPKPEGRTTTIRPLGTVAKPENIEAVVANVTIVGRGRPGFATVWPTGTRPTASSVNYKGDSLISNQVITKVAADGTFKVYTHSDAEVIVDITGYILRGSGVGLHQPIRLLDERKPQDYCCHRIKDDLLRIQVEQRPDAPKWNKHWALINVTVVGSTTPGFVSARFLGFEDFNKPTRKAMTSTQNYKAGTIRAAMAIVPVSEQGLIEIYRRGNAKVIVDMVGYVAKPKQDNAVPVMHRTQLNKTLGSTYRIGKQGELRLTLPRGLEYSHVSGPDIGAYQMPNGEVHIPGEKLGDTKELHLVLDYDAANPNPDFHYPESTRNLYIPVKVVPGSSSTGLGLSGYDYKVSERYGGTIEAGANFVLPMRSTYKPDTTISVKPGTPFQQVPVSEFNFKFDSDGKTLRFNMPSRAALRKHLGDYGDIPSHLILNMKNTHGHTVDVYVQELP